MNYNKIDIFGTAHWSARGSIDSEMWEWGLVINKNDIPLENRLMDKEAADFIRDLKPYLPDDYENRMEASSGIPGGSFDIEIPLKDFKHPDNVYSIIKQYFPKNIE